MFRFDARKPVRFCDGLTRRDFLHAGSLSMLGLGLPALHELEARGAVAKDRDVNCILLFLVGGPSQLDTWDLKPDAPEEIRGPFRPIDTKVAGLQVLKRPTLLKEAVQKANSFDGPKVRDALETISGFQGTSGVYDFSPTDHHGITKNPLFLGEIIDGKVKIVQ